MKLLDFCLVACRGELQSFFEQGETEAKPNKEYVRLPPNESSLRKKIFPRMNCTPHKTSGNTMASALKKRKRGHGDVVGAPKRAKSVKEVENPSLTPQLSQVTGWDAAFAPPRELVQTNGINGGSQFLDRPSSLEALDYGEYGKAMRKEEKSLQESGKKKKSKKHPEEQHTKRERKLLKKVLTTNDANSWKLSDPIGGRQISVDPVFTVDEK